MAAGHVETVIFGDAFVGRCHDDEAGDVWERVDFTLADIALASKWGGEGGGGRSGAGAAAAAAMFPNAVNMGRPIAAGQADRVVEGCEGTTWNQSADEVEIKVVVPAATKSKDAAIKFGAKSLKVTVNGVVRVEGTLGGNVMIDDCTYTLQDGEGLAPGEKLLLITMGKRSGNDNWLEAVVAKA